MPALAKERQQYHLSKVRSLIAENHQITFEEIKDQLFRRFELKLDRHYITRLAKKIFAERTKRADRLTLNYALAAYEDAMNGVVQKAWEIANAEYMNPQARVMALREIREAHSAVFEKFFDAGVFERKLGTLGAAIRNTPLPEDKKQAISAVFTNLGARYTGSATEGRRSPKFGRKQGPKGGCRPHHRKAALASPSTASKPARRAGRRSSAFR